MKKYRKLKFSNIKRYLFNKNIFKKINYTILFVLTLIVVFSINNLIYPFTEVPYVVNLKLDYFSKHKDEYNVVFIGSSRTYNGVDSNLFDRIVKEQKIDVKSFNLASSLMMGAEIDFLIEKILSLKPSNLKYIFVEYLDEIPFLLYSKNSTSMQYIYWHTLRSTILHQRLILASQTIAKNKLIATLENIRGFAYRFFRISRFSRIWQQEIQMWSHYKPKSTVDNSPTSFKSQLLKFKGYYSLDWNDNLETKKRNKDFLDDANSYQKTLDYYRQNFNKIERNKTIETAPNYVKLEIAKKIDNKIKKRGIKPIFLIAPSLDIDNSSTLVKLYKRKEIDTLFAFNNPQIYPDLHEVRSRFDRSHLNDRGAKIFTTLLAKKFIDYVEAK